MAGKSSLRLKLKHREKWSGRIDGEIFRNGVSLGKNTIATAFKNWTAKGMATGSYNTINKARLTVTGITAPVVNASCTGGGTGAEDNVTWEFEWTNTEGSSKTITGLEIGYDMGGGSETVYASRSGLTDVVEDDETVTYTWVFTFTYVSGGMTDDYRYQWAYLVKNGTTNPPNYIDFVDNAAGHHREAASLSDGGTGAEAYHEWQATYANGGGVAVTIDVIKLDYYVSTDRYYTEDDITDKAIDPLEELEATILLTHT